MQESTDSMIDQVYQALENDSQNGVVVALSNKDRQELDITFTDEDISCIEKSTSNKYIKEKVT